MANNKKLKGRGKSHANLRRRGQAKAPVKSKRKQYRPKRATVMPAAFSMGSASRRGEDVLRVVNDEWVADSALTFNTAKVAALVFYPGISSVPRLDQLAVRYEQFRIKRLSYKLVPRVGTTESGDVIAAIDYNPDSVPTTQSGVLVKNPQVQTPLYTGQQLHVEPSKAMKANWHRCFQNTASGPYSQPTATHALLIALGGDATAAKTHRVRVSYEIEFQNQTLATGLVENATAATNGTNWVGFTGGSITSVQLSGGSGLPITYTGEKSYWDTFYASLITNASVAIQNAATVAGQYVVQAVYSYGSAALTVALPAVVASKVGQLGYVSA